MGIIKENLKINTRNSYLVAARQITGEIAPVQFDVENRGSRTVLKKYKFINYINI